MSKSRMAIAKRQPRRNVIELHFENRGGQVRIVPPDRDIMAMPVEMAVEACRAFKQQILFKDQFDHLMAHLGDWLSMREDKVTAAYLTARDAGLLFLVVQSDAHRDSDIETALTELDLEITNDKDFNLISLCVHAIPRTSEDTIQSFLSEKFALRYVLNGKRTGPHRVRQQNAEDDSASSD